MIHRKRPPKPSSTPISNNLVEYLLFFLWVLRDKETLRCGQTLLFWTVFFSWCCLHNRAPYFQVLEEHNLHHQRYQPHKLYIIARLYTITQRKLLETFSSSSLDTNSTHFSSRERFLFSFTFDNLRRPGYLERYSSKPLWSRIHLCFALGLANCLKKTLIPVLFARTCCGTRSCCRLSGERK